MLSLLHLLTILVLVSLTATSAPLLLLLILLSQVSMAPEKRVKLLKNPVVRVSAWFLREDEIHITSFIVIENKLDFPVIGSPKLIPTSNLVTTKYPLKNRGTSGVPQSINNSPPKQLQTSRTADINLEYPNKRALRTEASSKFMYKSPPPKSPTNHPKPSGPESQVSVVSCLENLNLTKSSTKEAQIKYYSMQIAKEMRHLLNEGVWKCMYNDFRSESKKELISHIQQQHLKVRLFLKF